MHYMAKIIIDRNKCKGCLLCVSVCSKHSIEIDEQVNAKGIRTVRLKKNYECLGCAMCALVCPDVCIEVWK